jgi:hypothetical protein
MDGDERTVEFQIGNWELGSSFLYLHVVCEVVASSESFVALRAHEIPARKKYCYFVYEP